MQQTLEKNNYEETKPQESTAGEARKSMKKPDWLRARYSCCPEVDSIRRILRENKLHTVCEEATCPNLGECFRQGTATFLILGDTCTRNCPFCDVNHGVPLPPDVNEPAGLARAVAAMGLRYVVITSVTRDDLPDGGAGQYANCIAMLRSGNPELRIEILVPDFRGSENEALAILSINRPDVFNHNLETVRRLYPQVRPSADYAASLDLLRRYKELNAMVPTKSGIMLGFGERREEVFEAMQDLRDHGCDMLTLGQYLRPSVRHLPVVRYVPPEEFSDYREVGLTMGFSHIEAGPLVRSSYHAAEQAEQGIH
ncbi:MAG: lipoyl synthase [Geobacteraceae bacterium]|nr:lipoyl synthase [Geobacteraceae bacterium]